jgi:hypothetical protein
MTMIHPSREELINYYYGWLPARRATTVAAHMASCPFCALDTLLAEDYFEIVADTLPPTIPVRPAARETALGHLRRLVAQLVTRPAMALAGQDTANTPMLYEIGGVQIALQFVTMEAEVGIMGLVTGVEEWPLEAQLRVAAGNSGGMVVQVDEAGQFYFATVPTPPYEVVIVTPTLEIEVHVAAARS